jgi:hypothetical protein
MRRKVIGDVIGMHKQIIAKCGACKVKKSVPGCPCELCDGLIIETGSCVCNRDCHNMSGHHRLSVEFVEYGPEIVNGFINLLGIKE